MLPGLSQNQLRSLLPPPGRSDLLDFIRDSHLAREGVRKMSLGEDGSGAKATALAALVLEPRPDDM